MASFRAKIGWKSEKIAIENSTKIAKKFKK